MLNRFIKQWASATAALVIAGSASAASFSTAQYTVNFDAGTAFGGVSFTSGGSNDTYGFGWFVPVSIVVESDAAGTVSANFELPNFTITANPGYTLGGSITGFVGNLGYTAIRGAEVGGSINSALVSVDGGPATVVDSTLLGLTPTGNAVGYATSTITYAPGAVTSISVSGALLTLMASATGTQYATIYGQPQNEFRIAFTAAPIPEPESYAMLAAGLFLIGAIVRRRRA